MTPLVTVVIPTRNRSARVASAVASAQAQTEADIEIVVVDDASNDDTPAVLAQLSAADSRVRAVHQLERTGGSAARNRGIDEGRGEFVAFLDDDDRWLPRKLERQLAYLRAHPEVVLVGCHHREISEAGGPPVDFRGPTEFVADDLLWVNILGSASNAVVAPGRMQQPVRFDAAFPAYQDWDFYVRCNDQGPAAVVPEVLCEYVVHDEPDRLTNQLASRLAGHELFLERHQAAMSPACVAYHHARMRVLATTTRAEKVRLAPRLLKDAPPVVLRALWTESLHGRIGRATDDPARPMRQLQRLAAAHRSPSG